MNITLTHQDADLILKYIRKDLEGINQSNERIEESANKLIDSITKLRKHELDTEEEKEVSYAEAFADVTMDWIKSEYETVTKELTRCIELLTIGSEVTE